MMAVAMQRRMDELDHVWRERGLERPFRIRVGINTGFCTVVNFGSKDWVDYRVIGNEENLSSRLESGAEPGGIALFHETYSPVCEPPLMVRIQSLRSPSPFVRDRRL